MELLIFFILSTVTKCYGGAFIDSDPYCEFNNNWCHPYNSDTWKTHATFCLKCQQKAGIKRYHCARDYDNPEVFKEACAVEKFCKQGEEPILSYKENGKPITEPIVWCRECHDKNSYNDRKNTSSAEFSECKEKRNICTEDKHKILCEPESTASERFCRCDARKGFHPLNSYAVDKCSFDYECIHNIKCAEEEQLLLNYTCADKCPDGFDRLSEENDDCIRVTPIVTTKDPVLPVSPSKENVTTTTSKPVEKQCPKGCDDYQICEKGRCVCPDNCTDEEQPKPVCGYDKEADHYKTFASLCDLGRIYCRDREYKFDSDGGCDVPASKSNDTPINWRFILLILFCIIFLITGLVVCMMYRKGWFKRIRKGRRQQRKKESQIDGKSNNNISKENINNNSREESQSNGHHVVYKNYYKGPVIKVKGENANVKIVGNDDVQLKINANDEMSDEQSEEEPLLCGEETSPFNHSSIPDKGPEKSESITDIMNLIHDPDQRRGVVNNVMEKSSSFLNEHMEHTSVLDQIQTHQMFDRIRRKDIWDERYESDKKRKIISLVQKGGPKTYQSFKECLFDAKQSFCLEEVERIQQLEIKNLEKKNGELNNSMLQTDKTESVAGVSDNVYKKCQNKMDDINRVEKESENDPVRRGMQESKVDITPKMPISELEQQSLKCLTELKACCEIIGYEYGQFEKMCKSIQRDVPNINLHTILQELNLNTDHLQTENFYSYNNIPEGFVAYRSSGESNSCLYQSVSLLLTGKEDKQCCLRLLATLHAVKHFEDYKKKLVELDKENLKNIFDTHGVSREEMDKFESSEEIVAHCLPILIMETACLGKDSSVFHVELLQGALNVQIHQHFQTTFYHENTIPNVQEGSTGSAIPDLNIFWVDSMNNGGKMNHIVPLFPKDSWQKKQLSKVTE